jgi:hypothetical protein
MKADHRSIATFESSSCPRYKVVVASITGLFAMAERMESKPLTQNSTLARGHDNSQAPVLSSTMKSFSSYQDWLKSFDVPATSQETVDATQNVLALRHKFKGSPMPEETSFENIDTPDPVDTDTLHFAIEGLKRHGSEQEFTELVSMDAANEVYQLIEELSTRGKAATQTGSCRNSIK